ncbi:DUF2796 domain-containing protein [Paraglaciecola aquimarina]|uniref:DUF2796 domain-containing protein n=1 Tax=Paraglaciecola aquimarina TaxID=1235557 RepID=A0ABU3SUR7_9ALTE|nr:DUF2796 domain-containing protein [Paraglaciecola aquimarina]MDU0353733.1 DUF2796 domain-containing protein [Paraglaciecola aquimarina]
MKPITRVVSLVLGYMAMFTSSVEAQEHVHGVGSAFVIQQGQTWQLQFILPASDALGFEHIPEDQQQRDRLAKLSQSFKRVENLMHFHSNSASKGCEQIAYRHNLHQFDNGQLQQREHHQHEPEEHHEAEHKEPHQELHPNVELSYTVECSKDPRLLSFPIFQQMHSLQKLEVQWSIDSGQGAVMLSPNMTQLELQ